MGGGKCPFCPPLRTPMASLIARGSSVCFQSQIPFLMRKCTHLIVSAHISLRVKQLAHVCEREKQSQLFSKASALWFWRRIMFVVHFRDEFLSFLCCGTSCFTNNVSFFNQYSRFFPVYWMTRD